MFADAAGDEPIARIDTIPPGIASAETVGGGEVRVTLTEGVWGLVSAADRTVDGGRATGVSAGGGAPAAAIAMSGGMAFTLSHPGSGTGGTPAVEYSPQEAPGAAPDPAPPQDPDPPAPPAAGVEFGVGGLDGTAVRLGESRVFDIAITRVDGGGAAVVLLSGQPGLVTVQNTEINRTRVTVDAAYASAAAGTYTFEVVAAAGSDPATRQVTIAILP